MASNSRDEEVGSCSVDAQKFDLRDSSRDWPSLEPIASPTSTSPAWNTEDDDDSGSCVPGTRPSDLYGKFTWKIETFSQISKRELRSNIFEVGGYKWYILVYPQGCDVCNHLSLFLCVADYDKLLPGWSHFAQFTIAVVNKDPKKSKYSDTLHRFCKKEHDWGWKKFMELSKVFDGFIVSDTLVIKAQVQVIRENPHRPFRCLDCQYRRELIRVYLTNVESICRRFVEEKREKIGKLLSDSVRWSSFRSFWSAVEENMRCRLSREKAEIILKAIVKCFFNEKEVTSTLVMDALYSGYRALDYRTKNKKGFMNGADIEQTHSPIVWVDKDFFVLADDMLLLLERASNELMPFYKDEKGPQNRTKDGCSGDDFGKDNFDRDEKRLTELGRRTVEMFVLGHLFSNRIEVAYLEAIALKRQEELIREEEAAEQAEIKLKAKREAAEKEKRNKKKQAKQRRNSRKEKEKLIEIKHLGVQESRQLEDSTSSRDNVSSLSKGTSIMGDEDNDSSVLDNVDGVVGTLRPAIEDGDADWMIWEREGSEMHLLMEASFSGGSCLDSTSNGLSNQAQGCLLDDSSSTCSSDSILSTLNGAVKKRSSANLIDLSQTSVNRGHGKLVNDKNATQGVSKNRSGNSCRMDDTCTCNKCDHDKDTVIASLKKRVEWLQRRLSEKEELVATLQKQLSCYQHQVSTDSSNNGNGNKETIDISKGDIKHESIENARNDTEKPLTNSVDIASLDVGNPVNEGIDSKSRVADNIYKDNLPDVHAASVTYDVTDSRLSRPSSAPDLPESSSILPETTPLWNVPPSLTRSVSAMDRLGATTATEPTSSLSSMRQGSGIIPSYRNAAVGATRSTSPFSTCSTTSHNVDAGFRNDLQCSNICLRGGLDQSAIPHSVSDSTSLSDSDGIRYTNKSDRMDAGNSSQQSECRENTVGFTFGTVTPEMLHLQQQQKNHIGNGHSAPEFSSQKLRRVLHGYPIPERDFSSSSNECRKSLSQHIALHAKHTMTDMAFSGAAMPEEFPHLDIINELLDDDKMLGAKALNVFLQQTGNQNLQPPLTAFDIQRTCGGQIGLDVNAVDDRTDRSVMPLDNCTVSQFSNGPDHRLGSHGDSMQLLPYSCSISQHGGLAMSEHHWQGSRGSLRVTDGFQSDMDILIGYPMQTHIPIPDCPPFSLGQNGYSLYSPVQHP